MQEKKISIGLMSFINALPFNYSLEIWDNKTFIFTSGYPSMLNNLFHNEQLHIAPVSSIEYLKNQKDYKLIKNVGICSDGEVGSVLLFSNCKIEDLQGKRIGVPHTSSTSITLLKIILYLNGVDINSCEFIKHKYEISLSESLKGKFDATLYIGDPALIANYMYSNSNNCHQALRSRDDLNGNGFISRALSPSPNNFIKYDLGQQWKKITGLPFVFATWVAWSDWARYQKDDCEWVSFILNKAVDAGFDMYFNEITDKAANSINLPTEYIEDYYKNKIKYKMDSSYIESLELFWQKSQLI